MKKEKGVENLSEDEEMEENENDLFTFSNENYKNEKILDEKFDQIGEPFDDNYDDISLFERKKLALELFIKRERGENVQIEKILELDNTNKKIQCEYIKIAVDKLIKENNEDKILILIEKINKAGIICDEQDYNKMIENIPEKYKSSVGYVNYKKTLIASLESLLNREKEKDFENVNIVFKSFQFKKKYEFNHECEAGENNYYFYSLIYQIIISNLKEKLHFFEAYRLCIKSILEFIKNYDYSNPKDIDMNFFEFLFNLLIDDHLILKKSKKFNLIEKYINSYKNRFIEKNEIDEAQINEFNEHFIKFKNELKNPDYTFFVEEGKIKIKIKEEPNISRRKKCFEKIYKFDINMFNNDILTIIKRRFKF